MNLNDELSNLIETGPPLWYTSGTGGQGPSPDVLMYDSPHQNLSGTKAAPSRVWQQPSGQQASTGHRRSYVPDANYCEKCNKSFTSHSGFDRHMLTHEGKFKFWCDECKKGFQAKNAYDQHVARHQGKTYPCQWCNKRFNYEYSLRYHMSQHTGKYLYNCCRCDLGFNLKKDFEEHENKHEGVSFKCRNCQKDFYAPSKRDIHEKTCIRQWKTNQSFYP